MATASTSASITELDQTGYQVRISATNFEGDSGWSQITVGDLPNSPPTASTSASITELDQTGYQVRISATNFEGDSGWSQITVGDLPNSPPTVSAPTNALAQYIFPFGEPGDLKYDAPAGLDSDGDSRTYSFTVTLDQESPPEDALLSFAPDGDSFTVKASRTMTPQKWNDTHSEDGISRRITASLYANDGKDKSEPAEFDLDLYYDPSAFFNAPAVHQADNRYTGPDLYETYEGPAAGSNIQIPWSAAVTGTRVWAAGNPSTPATCRQGEESIDLVWPVQGNEDSRRFDAPGQTTGKDNILTPVFTIAPDFENPDDTGADNVYHLRLHNVHDLHNPEPGSSFPSCSGSAVDVRIRVKDVGPPAPIIPTGAFVQGDPETMEISWDEPTGFMENGSLIPFPHNSFQPTSYDYRYRETGVLEWTVVPGLTSTEVTITELTGDSYQLNVRAVNTEGKSPWPDSVTVTVALNLEPPEVPDTPMTGRATDTLLVNWVEPEDNGFTITRYGVQYRKASDTVWEDHFHQNTETNTVIGDLDAGTSYQVQVNAVSRGGTSGWSDPPLTASTRTPPPLTASIAAESATVTEGEAARFTVTLSRAEAATVNLSLAYTEGYGDNSTLSAAVPNTGRTTITVPTRRSASSQGGRITVTINTGNGYQIGADNTDSTAIERDPEPPGFARAPQVQGLTETRIAISWPEPDSDHLQTTGYGVKYREQGQTNWRSWGHNDTSREATITSLRMNTTYEVQVNGTSQAGTGPWSETGTSQTLDLVASMTADSGSVTEGETAQFIVTLSRGAFANIRVKLQWTGDFGDAETRTVQTHGQTTAKMEVQTRRGSTTGGGRGTVLWACVLIVSFCGRYPTRTWL